MNFNSNKANPVSSDDRRDIFEYVAPAAVTKVLVTKRQCVLGRHYHKLKSEYFVLLAGKGYAHVGDRHWEMSLMEGFDVPPGTPHWFELNEGSIFLGFCSMPHDPSDDYPINE
jgi:quercetin dioxygenase-like cupin family protein